MVQIILINVQRSFNLENLWKPISLSENNKFFAVKGTKHCVKV